METGRRAWTSRRMLPVALVVGCSVLLSGCSGGVRDSTAQAVEEGSSSMATATLAVRLDVSGRLTPAATSTALDDALEELGKIRTDVLELPVTVQSERQLRDEALAVLDDCVSAVSVATQAIASRDGQPSLAQAGALLDSAAARLSGLESRLGSP
jgi:hypothetical protein